MKEGGTARSSRNEGHRTLDSIYYAFGAADVIGICDMPDTISGLALTLAVNASGALRLSTTPIVSVEEIDSACNSAGRSLVRRSWAYCSDERAWLRYASGCGPTSP